MKVFKMALIADTHVGSSVALWHPDTPIHEGGRWQLNKQQQLLLYCWNDMIARIEEIKPDIGIHLGDIIHGDSPREGQLITRQPDEQAKGAKLLMQPFVAAVRKFYMVKGTEWHEGRASKDVNRLAEELGAVSSSLTEQFARWDLYLRMPGNPEREVFTAAGAKTHFSIPAPVLHIAHHIGMSSVPWYEATVPLRDTLMHLAELVRNYGEQAPNVRMVVRAHRHRFCHVHVAPDVHALVVPCWQFKTALAHKKVSASVPQIGWVLVEWDGRDLVVKERIYQLPAPHVEEGLLQDFEIEEVLNGNPNSD